MNNHFVIRYLLLLFASVLISMRVNAQHVDDFNLVAQRLINRDIKTIVPHHQDSIKVNEYLKNITRCIATRNDSALIYANQAIILAEKAGLVKKISVALQELGQYFMSKEDFAGAISCFIN